MSLTRHESWFSVFSITDMTVNTDPNNPSFFTNLIAGKMNGFELSNTVTGEIKNISGRTMEHISGFFSFHPDKSGGGVTNLIVFSEKSADDGVTWDLNPYSMRTIEVSNSGESFHSLQSFTADWNHGEVIRFRAYAKSGGVLSLVSTEETVLNGKIAQSVSFSWTLSEM